MKVKIPPIKAQGIKTKLVPWISGAIPKKFNGLWIEPFMGTSVVGFNLAPKRALMCDTNPHLVNFYEEVKHGHITPNTVREFLTDEGTQLIKSGEEYYYKVRDRFNKKGNPLDFLFLNRAGFNGMIRFNRKRELNIPFCRKPKRFSKSYITKIVNQAENICFLLKEKDFVFKCQSFEETIQESRKEDLIYCDPPYIGRHVDYYNGWDSDKESHLFNQLDSTKSRFILSTWHHNDFRRNEYIEIFWKKFNVYIREHFYHVGASEKNRNPMVEAIVTNYDASVSNSEI